MRAAADTAAAAVVAAATKTAFIKAGQETALGKRLELERRASDHSAQVTSLVPHYFVACVAHKSAQCQFAGRMKSYFFGLCWHLTVVNYSASSVSLHSFMPPMQELERSVQYTRSLGKRDLIDPLRLGKDGCFAAALATAVAASVAAESAAQAAQAAVDSRKDVDQGEAATANSSGGGSKRSRRHAAHAQAHAAAATRASGAATLAAAQAIQLASKAGPSRGVTADAAKTAPSSTSAPSSGQLIPPMTSPMCSSRPSSQPSSSSSLVASPGKKSTSLDDPSQSAMASPLFRGNGDDDDDDDDLLDDLDGGDYVAKWQVQR